MTHDVLQSDIDLARRLLETRRPASEIVTALTYRGVNSDRATQLVSDIESGKTVEPDRPITIHLPGEATAPIIVPASASERKSISPKTSNRRAGKRSRNSKTDAFPWAMLIAMASAVVCIGAFAIINHKTHGDSAERGHFEAADKSVSVPDAADRHKLLGGPQPKDISLEIQKDGFRLCNKSVAREDFLNVMFKILGSPSRTNQIENVERVIYAYDAYGILLYSPRNSGNCSVVLDFEATGGAAGTKNAFVGTLKVCDRALCATTDAASLALIRELGLEPAKSASGIFRAQFEGFELVFAYFERPDRLSLAEIDFK